MHFQILLMIFSITLNKIDGVPWSFTNVLKNFKPDTDAEDFCPKDAKCLRSVDCPEQNRTTSKTHKLCSGRYGGPWVCCLNHIESTLEYSSTPNLNLIEPLLRTRSSVKNVSEETVVVDIHAESYGDSPVLGDSETDVIQPPSGYRRHYEYGSYDSSSESNHGRDSDYYPSRDYSHKDSDYDYEWSDPSGSNHGNGNPHGVNTHSRVTSNPGKESSYWNSKSTVRPSVKTTTSSWRGNSYGKTTTQRGYKVDEVNRRTTKASYNPTKDNGKDWNSKSTVRPSVKTTTSSWRGNSYGKTTTQKGYKVDEVNRTTKASYNPPRDNGKDSSGKDSDSWNSKSTIRPYTKTTESSWWGNGYGKTTTQKGYKVDEVNRTTKASLNPNGKDSSEDLYRNAKPTMRPSTTKSSWRNTEGRDNSNKYTSTRSPTKGTTTRPSKNPWNSYDTSSSTAKTMVHGNRVPTKPSWDGGSSERSTTKYLVLSTTPAPRRKPWGTTQPSTRGRVTTTKSSTRGRVTTTKSSTRGRVTTTKPSYGRTTVSTRMPSTTTRKTWTPSTESPTMRRPGPTSRSTSGKLSTTKRYSSTTPIPDVNLHLCGIRQPDEISSRVRSSRLEHNPDVVIFPETSNGGKSRQIFQRIVGGREAEPFSWPWVAALYRVDAASGGNRFLSGGSLINENYVLTAAHIFTKDDLRTASFVVMLGTHTAKEAVAEYAVDSIAVHPRYQNRLYYYDIALLRLSRPVSFNSYVMPVCLPSPAMPLIRDEDIEGKTATVMGWGDVSFGGITSRVLMEASFPIVSRKTCNASYTRVASSRFPQGITDKMLCAADPRGGKDACQGDSGGPLTTVENGRYTQVGIVSFGFKCGDKDYPGVYTKVASYLSWIAENTNTRDYDYYSS